MKYTMLFIGYVVVILTLSLPAEGNTINFFFKPYPPQSQELPSELIEKFIAQPGKLSRYLFKKYMNLSRTEGICCSYTGYTTFSNAIGQVTFVRNHAKPSFIIVVTPKINPIMMIGLTIHHLELFPSTPYSIYEVSEHQDAETGIIYWKTEELQSLANNIIPLNAITIFANPSHVYIPTGITPKEKPIQLVLPSVYVKKGINRVQRAAWLVSIRQFFKPIYTESQSPTPTMKSLLFRD